MIHGTLWPVGNSSDMACIEEKLMGVFCMSYDLAVWEGKVPSTDDELAEAFERNMVFLDCEPAPEPTPRIRAYVDALLARWPDLSFDGENDSPWSDWPLIGNAAGPVIYFGMVYDRAEEVSAFAAQLAKDLGLVCLDPQLEALRP
ncbi:hypothetical protein [Arthrobacter sp. 35W]|uniref:hypothetical protein n=1 Tax=Arthrobacter sp. 35W TaxID=1132441 RepID=UPI0018C8F566|nr:hypothetical protein [Arthrobacter sp. 35W]